MDLNDDHHEAGTDLDSGSPKPRALPDDLPRSLDDRRLAPTFGAETEIYDAWQGQSQFFTTPVPARPLDFRLSLEESRYRDDPTALALEDNDSRLVEMLAAQAAHRADGPPSQDEDGIATSETLSEAEKRELLQKALNMAASNGDVERVQRLVNGRCKDYVDVNAADEEGAAPLIYASCFGHHDVVSALIDAGADLDTQDRNQWSPLMWAMTNRHKNIAKTLLDHGASPDVRSSSGRTAFDFLASNTEISDYLHESGYKIGNVGVGDDFYDGGLTQDKFEEEMAENEMKRRMMMESAINLEVDLSSLGLDEQPESPEELEEEGQEFVWDRCLHDQMFVFQENELGRILDIIITNMTPQRSPSQKPVPANILFLSSRYAHYHASPELLQMLLVTAMDKINDVVERHQWDMTILAFWISNATLLMHYLKKDPGLMEATTSFQLQLAELINEIFVLIIRDAERRMDKLLDAAMLDHEIIPGFEDVQFQNEWKLFKSKSKAKEPEPIEKRFRPPSPRRRAQIAPRNITSLLSSTLFVLDLYDIHSVITVQILAQLLYWLGAELFNRVMSNRKYLARTKAMQIRMNVSILEDWARANNREPEHFESGSMNTSGESTVDAARRHLAPTIQLLQWLQCFSSLGEDFESLVDTIQQLTRLTPQQLVHAVRHYRPEVGERGLPKSAMKYLINLEKEFAERRESRRKAASSPKIPISPQRASGRKSTDDPSTSTPAEGNVATKETTGPSASGSTPTMDAPSDEEEPPENLLQDPSLMLPFILPTSTDMLVSYGAGFGGVNRERERKYIPTVPPEFLAKFDTNGTKKEIAYDSTQWEDGDEEG
ncbi:DIL and ankyrin domain-containing protein [Xylona heveae TC161]|uniref:DIL and ankyrin domain-containing protein n=1 Tax=Xylona heveae (strain CBS 132557 / TC161) TaxID=1328760 RepID=A0A161TGG0_XYLHT|nr:DIL and ankyrin domain-containing protein [Xylona heveae TC161]KZF25237.1 DIL and ankyrin domain-containing protein [Xylona heveae TC161]